MDLSKIPEISEISLKMKKGRTLVSSRKMTLETLFDVLCKKFNQEKAELAKGLLLDGHRYRFKLDGYNFNALPLQPKSN